MHNNVCIDANTTWVEKYKTFMMKVFFLQFVLIQNFVFLSLWLRKMHFEYAREKNWHVAPLYKHHNVNIMFNIMYYCSYKSWLLMQDQDNNPTNNLCFKLADISVFTCYDIVRVNHSRWKISFVRVEHWSVAHRNIMWQRNAFLVWECLWLWCFH